MIEFNGMCYQVRALPAGVRSGGAARARPGGIAVVPAASSLG
jgi:hypothetical protein